MKQTINLRRVLPLVAMIALLLTFASCASTSKYGCPNHIGAR